MSKPRSVLKELLGACAIALAIGLWRFHKPILNLEVPAFGVDFALPPGRAMLSPSETYYQVLPPMYAANRSLREGRLPLWMPSSGAGTPLLGKMTNGIFSPWSLPGHLVRERAIPLAFTLQLLLKIFFAYLFTYLLCRTLSLTPLFANFASAYYAANASFTGFLVYSVVTSAVTLPLHLALIEMYFRGRRRSAALLLPWTIALPFLGGHFETAFLGNCVGAAYFMLHLFAKPSSQGPSLGRHLPAYAACALAGLVLCAFQISSGWEYVANSYTSLWRSLPEIGWKLHSTSKNLTRFDALLIGAALALLFPGWIFYKRALGSIPERPAGGLRNALVSIPFLAASVCLLGACGLDQTALNLFAHRDSHWLRMSMDIGLILLACHAALGRGATAGARALSWITAATAILLLKTPPLTNLIAALPIFRSFHNVDYHWQFKLGIAILSALGAQRLSKAELGIPAARRRNAARSLLAVLIPWLGWNGAWLIAPIIRGSAIPGLHAFFSAGPDAGLLGPDLTRVFSGNFAVRGWLPAEKGPPQLSVGIRDASGGVLANREPTEITARGNRIYFSATLEIPPERRTLDVIVGSRSLKNELFRFPPVQLEAQGTRARWAAPFLLAALLLPAAFLMGESVPRIFLAASFLALLLQKPFESVPLSQTPLRLPGIARILQDKEIFRVHSFSYDFLRNDYLAMYGLQDFRTGADNLGVLWSSDYQALAQDMFSGPNPETRRAALKLLGLANVKYILDFPDKKIDHPALLEIYRGRDMVVYRNMHFLGRAALYYRFASTPVRVKSWKTLEERSRTLTAFRDKLKTGELDPARMLLLHETPPSVQSPGQTPAESRPPRIEFFGSDGEIVRVRADSPHPGFLFVSNTDFPGWKAYVDEKPAKIFRGWLAFMAIAIPAGNSDIRLVYESLSVRILLLAALLAAMAWAWMSARETALAAKIRGNSPLPYQEVSEKIASLLIASNLIYWSLWVLVKYPGGWICKIGAALLLLSIVRLLGLKITPSHAGVPYGTAKASRRGGG